MDDLARQLSAHPRFRWASGMRTVRGYVFDMSQNPGVEPDQVPDLTDPATAGVLLSWLDRATLADVHVMYFTRETMGARTRWCRVEWMGAAWESDVFGEAVARALLAVWGPA